MSSPGTRLTDTIDNVYVGNDFMLGGHGYGSGLTNGGDLYANGTGAGGSPGSTVLSGGGTGARNDDRRRPEL